MPTKLHLIAYISDARVHENEVDNVLDDIVRTARKENKKHHITGVLYYMQGKFLQVIEGREQDLRQLMQNIEADPRHSNVTYLINEQTLVRGFKKWNMSAFELGRGHVFDAETLQQLTAHFKKTLLPRSDLLVRYYKTLLQEKSR